MMHNVPPTQRQITPDEVLQSTQLHLARLCRGVTDMDNDRPEGVFDVGSSLRSLVGHGQGNRLLLRLYEYGIHRAIRFAPISQGLPTITRRLVRFELGGMPEEATTETNQRGPSLEEFLATHCLRIVSTRLKEEVLYTWDDLISVIANKLGAVHTDEERRAILDDLACYLIGGVPALRYVLRTVGAAVVAFGSIQLQYALSYPIPPLYQIGKTELTAATVLGSIDEQHLEVTVCARFHKGVETDLLSWTQRGDPDWLFHPPQNIVPNIFRRSTLVVGRNERCPCGSGRKFKKCCGR